MVDWDNYNNNTKKFSLEDEIIDGKVISVYDGDTVSIVLNLPLNNKLFKWNCRLARVDTPELRTKNKKEKEFGYEVRNKLREKILNNVLSVKCLEFDKYGRLLVELNTKDDLKENINDWLINKYDENFISAFFIFGNYKRIF
jgi:endonuclease YncB( thermonuclease family)